MVVVKGPHPREAEVEVRAIILSLLVVEAEIEIEGVMIIEIHIKLVRQRHQTTNIRHLPRAVTTLRRVLYRRRR